MKTMTEVLAELRFAYPARADRFRLAKTGDSIAVFEPDQSVGTIVVKLEHKRAVFVATTRPFDFLPFMVKVEDYEP